MCQHANAGFFDLIKWPEDRPLLLTLSQNQIKTVGALLIYAVPMGNYLNI